jgi:hypothetical protein
LRKGKNIITPELIEGLITENDSLFIPSSTLKAIGKCLLSTPEKIEERGVVLKNIYQEYEHKSESAKIDYSDDITLDAYTVYYMPRSTLIPKIAIDLLSYCEGFQEIPQKLKILDLGSGSGGVVVGLLDLFSNDALSNISLEIIAIDVSAEALGRQKEIMKHIGHSNAVLRYHRADLSKMETCEEILQHYAPYDLIFSGSLLTELNPTSVDALIKELSAMLNGMGVAVIAEAPRDYVIKQIARISNMARALGLHVYYPCPPKLECPKAAGKGCWVWRRDEFVCSTIDVNGEFLQPTNILPASWIILSTRPYSIYDGLQSQYPNLILGALAPGKTTVEGEVSKQSLEVCTPKGRQELVRKRKAALIDFSSLETAKRGSIIGFSEDFSEVRYFYPPSKSKDE